MALRDFVAEAKRSGYSDDQVLAAVTDADARAYIAEAKRNGYSAAQIAKDLGETRAVGGSMARAYRAQREPAVAAADERISDATATAAERQLIANTGRTLPAGQPMTAGRRLRLTAAGFGLPTTIAQFGASMAPAAVGIAGGMTGTPLQDPFPGMTQQQSVSYKLGTALGPWLMPAPVGGKAVGLAAKAARVLPAVAARGVKATARRAIVRAAQGATEFGTATALSGSAQGLPVQETGRRTLAELPVGAAIGTVGELSLPVTSMLGRAWQKVRGTSKTLSGVDSAHTLAASYNAARDDLIPMQAQHYISAMRAKLAKFKIPQDRWEIITRAVQNPAVQATLTDPKERGAVLWLRNKDKQLWNELEKRGLAPAFAQYHFPRMWKEKLPSPPSKGAAQAANPGGRSFSTYRGWQEHRQFATIEEGEAAGLHPATLDPALLLGQRYADAHRVMLDADLKKQLYKLRQNGEKMFKPKPTGPIPQGMVKAELPGQPALRYLPASTFGPNAGTPMLIERPYVAHPAVADLLKRTIGAQPGGKAYRAATGLHSGWKGTVMLNPLIHGRNVISEAMTVSGLTAGGAHDTYRLGQSLLAKPAAAEEMAAAGVHFGHTQPWQKELREILAPENTRIEFGRATSVPGMKQAQALLFDKLIPAMQAGIYQRVKDQLGREFPNLAEAELKRMAATTSNDLMGHLPRYLVAPAGQKWLRFLLFAPNWTVSKLRLPAGAVAPGKVFKGFTPEARAALGAQYQAIMANTFAGFFGWLDQQTRVLSGHGQAENPEGQMLRVDTGAQAPGRREAYFNSPMFPAARETAEWFPTPHDPLKPVARVAAKSGPIVRTAGGIYTAATERQLTPPERRARVVQELQNWNPWSRFLPVSGAGGLAGGGIARPEFEQGPAALLGLTFAHGAPTGKAETPQEIREASRLYRTRQRIAQEVNFRQDQARKEAQALYMQGDSKGMARVLVEAGLGPQLSKEIRRIVTDPSVKQVKRTPWLAPGMTKEERKAYSGRR